MGDKPITHTDRSIHDNIRDLARYMRRNPTPTEDRLWQRIRKKQVHGFRFRRQQAIGRFIVDFYCFEARLVDEIDGAIHDEPSQAEYDKERELHLESLGFHVLRFTNNQVTNNLNAVVDFIGDWLAKHAPSRTARSGRN